MGDLTNRWLSKELQAFLHSVSAVVGKDSNGDLNVVNVDDSGILQINLNDGTTSLSLDPFVQSVPVTDTFHHLGHEGKVFIHSDRHSAIANGASLDILICIPAGEPNRQVHMRFFYTGKANTGTLDIDIIMYKGVTVSAEGSVEPITSTNDAVVRTTGVLMWSGPTVTDLGERKASAFITGEKKSASSKDQAVPEWVWAPDGNDIRYYLMRATNNSGGTVDIENALFFYDSHSVLV